ncbi:DNA mismatch repair endonuclease MutL [Alkaliphilus crotonatoxidans]
MIRLLDDQTINKIAAGEVVEGPYSIVKELVENAIDAQASSIILEIKEGGKKLIRVTDNGVGIPENQVESAFLRHATSKISGVEDLEKILSLGFRGEALASIASISQIEVITRPKNQVYGMCLELSGGMPVSQRQVGCPPGTTMMVKNIFFNTPARMKFMKSTSGETGKITEIITRLALSRPDISFKYINNNNIMFTTPGTGDLSQVILSVFDRELYQSLIYLDSEQGDYRVEGFISQPTYLRGNRNYEIIFINGRYVKSKVIYQAIENAYRERLPINKYPLCILNIHLDPSTLDVNVHPTKTEVKFHQEESLRRYVEQRIEQALSSEMMIPPIGLNPLYSRGEKTERERQIPFNEPSIKPVVPTAPKVFEKPSSYEGERNLKVQSGPAPQPLFKELVQQQQKIISDTKHQSDLKERENIKQQNFLADLLNDTRVIGQLFQTYIVLEKNHGMYLIDQHAAHERLNYNRLKREFETAGVVTQQLLAPQVISLSAEDYEVVKAYLPKFKPVGFEIEDFGQNTIIIRGVPMILGIPRNYQFLLDTIDELKTGYNKHQPFHEKLIQKSCKESIKAMDSLKHQEVMALLEDLSQLEPPLTCPHGRPIVLMLTKHEIEKHFKRIQ